MLWILGTRPSWRPIEHVIIASRLRLRLFYLRAKEPTTTAALPIHFRPRSRSMATEAATSTAPAGIADEPAAGQTVLHDGKRYTTIREGLAFILVPEAAAGDDGQKKKPKLATGADDLQTVFYNPIQQFNRDLSVLAIRAHGKQVMEKRTRDHQRRMDQFADKKRKRQERREANRDDAHGREKGQEEGEPEDDAEPPRKLSKVSNDAAETQKPAPPPAPVPAGIEGQEASADGDASRPAQAEERQPKKGPSIRILDALSATGLRALRYAHELPFQTTVVSNDLLEAAVASIKLNVRHNKLEEKVVVNHGNAVGHMYSIMCEEMAKGAAATGTRGPGPSARQQQQQQAARSQKYDVIDLDPYGTAATFLDAAVQAVRDDGGLLCVTCTDPGVWAHCEHCNTRMHLAGPMYAGRLHSPEFIKAILDDLPAASADVYGTTERIQGMLTTALEEMMEPREDIMGAGTATNGGAAASVERRDKLASVQVKEDKLAEIEPYPFFFSPSVLAKVVHCKTPDEDSIRSGLASLGYRVTRSHCKPGSIKTDAPWSAVWEVMREWVRQKAPVKDGSIKPGTAGHHIMAVGGGGAEGDNEEGGDEKPKVDFELRVGRNGKEKKLVRYQVNPRENWGPQAKATGM
ncbi:N2,N2-dimethylguanosine tRNA methyltransferase [Magnaporthiopsis poae ATCC 64411]|uniref:tRNA (guanine(26)-N(2))-dimethyltransferase n=1 Tax=Magnaporthiopsis poae (strain ATCC 64411 / 73-15) TaxID=644358 RepID=A0A0C4DYN9_MAGP6|nr:N2,N2-dimethylguanosine tRNA methyltransferase [Magnaporthiopsis poae ATCC 64411]